MEQTLGLYLHIPFCKSKCAYCDFYSLPHSEEKMDAYAAALLRHLEEVAPRCTAHTVDTVYFGGGTPSYLGEKRLTHLLKAVKKRFHVASDAEITLEANPDSAGDWKALRTLRKAGFNRISLGVQAADDDLLRRIGRVHTWEQALSAAAAARMAGFDNLSLDLIYGLPGQTLEAWQDTLRSAAALEPQHLSCYGLKVEPGTPLWQQRDSADLPDDDTQADMYLWTVDYLQKKGYEQYEISNFARFGHTCRHNCGYWQGQDFLGMGPSAVSTIGGKRWTDAEDFGVWLENTSKGLLGGSPEVLSPLDRILELIMLRLRTVCGLSYQEYTFRTGRVFRKDYGEYLKALTEQGLITLGDTGCRLTREGMLVSNAILSGFFDRAGRIFGEARD